MENKLSKFITSFTKLHETQHYMVTMLEKWRKDICKKDLSALYLWIYQKNQLRSFVDKTAYGFSKNALNLTCNYLKHRKQKVQINNNFSAEKLLLLEFRKAQLADPFYLIYSLMALCSF